MIRLSLCMIVKNEEAVLTRVLASAIQFADEILVADTGSTDRTVEIFPAIHQTYLSLPVER